MSLFDRIEQRSIHPRDPALVEWFGGGPRAASGVNVTAEKALGVPAFWSGVRLICETLAALPLVLLKATGNKTDRARSHPLYRVIHEEPNEWQTSMEFREMCQAHILLRGVSYSVIVETKGGYPEQLIPLHPDRVTPRHEALRPGGPKVRYWSYQPTDGEPQIFFPGELFIVPGISIFDLLKAEDPIKTQRDSIGLAIAEQSFAGHFFANGVQPSGVLEHPNKLKDDAHKRLKADFAARNSGTGNAGRTLILEEGMKWNQIGLTNKDAQYIESRKFSVTDIARILRVPPHLIYDLERATFSNIEHQGIEFVKYTMLPWFVRWEQRISKHLLGPTERQTLYPKFIAEGLLRGGMESRYRAYAIGRQWGWLSANNILELEDRNPIGPEGDIFVVPLNMVPADQAGKEQEPEPEPAAKPEPEEDDEEDERTALRQRIEVAHVRFFLDAAQRILAKEAKAAQRAIAQARTQKSVAPLDKWLESYDEGHETLVARTLLPAIEATAESIAALSSSAPTTGQFSGFAMTQARQAARRHVSKQRAEVREALTGTYEQRATALEALVTGWESRASVSAGDEVTAVSASVQKLIPAISQAA